MKLISTAMESRKEELKSNLNGPLQATDPTVSLPSPSSPTKLYRPNQNQLSQPRAMPVSKFKLISMMTLKSLLMSMNQHRLQSLLRLLSHLDVEPTTSQLGRRLQQIAPNYSSTSFTASTT